MGTCGHQHEAHRAEVRFLFERPGGDAGAVTKHEVIRADIAPTAIGRIHDLELRGLPRPRPHVPSHRFETIAVLARGAANHLSPHQQIHARPVFLRAATDEKIDEVALEGEGFAREFSRRAIGGCARVTVHRALAVHGQVALISGHFGFLNRAAAERSALNRPAFVIVALEIIEGDVGPGRGALTFATRRGAALERHRVIPRDNPVLPQQFARRSAPKADGVLQPAAEFRLDFFGPGVLDRETHHRRGQR